MLPLRFILDTVDFSAKRCRWLHDIMKTGYQVTDGMHAHPDVEGQLHCHAGMPVSKALFVVWVM